MLGHCGEETLRLTAKANGWELSGKLDVCADCAIGKAKQKNTNKHWSNGSKIPGERLFVDISSIKGESYGGAKFWALVVDDCTDFCWSFFMKSKSDLKGKVSTLIKELKSQSNIIVKYLRCDDAGENQALEKLCKLEGLGIKFEYSGPRTPQRNGRVERKFQTLYGRVRAMLNGAGLKDEFRSKLWAESASTATYGGNLLVTQAQSESPFELLYGEKPKCIQGLRSFGEMGVVTTGKKIQGKLEDKGTICMFIGYPPNHACDVYRMFNLNTKQVVKSRDIIWLK
jgi:hypothetical protein